MKVAQLCVLVLLFINVAKADVVDDIDRCAKINEATARLACYDQTYAALRAQLVSVRQLFSGVAQGAAAAATPTNPTQAISQAVQQSGQRQTPSLEQIENQAPKSNGFLASIFGKEDEPQTQPESDEAEISEEPKSAEDLFGSERELYGEDLLVTKAKKLPKTDQVTARLVEVERKAYGNWLLTLDNGQVWYQNEATNRGKFQVGDTVIIKRSKFSSAFFLTNQAGGRTINVRRVE